MSRPLGPMAPKKRRSSRSFNPWIKRPLDVTHFAVPVDIGRSTRLVKLRVPQARRHIHMVGINEPDAFLFEKLTLHAIAAERIPFSKATVFENHAMARRFHRLGVSAKRPPDIPSRTRAAYETGDLPVGGYLPLWDAPYLFEHLIGEIAHETP